MSKKYYWLRLNKDFFARHDIRIIESMPNGKDYVLFYLKLMAESVSHEGCLRFSDTIPYDENMLATITYTNVDIVRAAMGVLQQLNLMEIMDDETIYMKEVEKLIGAESDAHVREQGRIRQQRYRANKKLELIGGTKVCVYCGGYGDTIDHIIPRSAGGSDDVNNVVCSCLQCNMEKTSLSLDGFLNNRLAMNEPTDIDGIMSNPKLNVYVSYDASRNRFEPLQSLHNAMSRVTCNGEIELEIEKEIDIDKKEIDKEKSGNKTKHKYGKYNNVLLSDDDIAKLQNEFPYDWENRIENLSEAIEVHGYKYKNHLATIRAWARKDANKPSGGYRRTKAQELDDLYSMDREFGNS